MNEFEATAEIGEFVRCGLVARRIVPSVFKYDPDKPAAWISASHKEKDPKKSEPPTP